MPHADPQQEWPWPRDQLCLRVVDGNGSVGHGGGAPSMNGDLRIYPKSAYVVVVLANFDPLTARDLPTTSTAASTSRSASSRHALYTRSCAGSSGRFATKPGADRDGCPVVKLRLVLRAQTG